MNKAEAEKLMASEKPWNVDVPLNLKVRASAAAVIANKTLKEFVADALEEAMEPYEAELAELYQVGAGVIARNRRRRENRALKAEGQG